MRLSLPFALLALLFAPLPLASAQFNLFDHFFGGQQQAQQQQQQQRRPDGPSFWAAQADNMPCNAYQCPSTLACVSSPSECPCPSTEDVKCLVSDGESGQATVVCVRGRDGCEQVQRLSMQL